LDLEIPKIGRYGGGWCGAAAAVAIMSDGDGGFEMEFWVPLCKEEGEGTYKKQKESELVIQKCAQTHMSTAHWFAARRDEPVARFGLKDLAIKEQNEKHRQQKARQKRRKE
jgi:hypothetical protein